MSKGIGDKVKGFFFVQDEVEDDVEEEKSAPPTPTPSPSPVRNDGDPERARLVRVIGLIESLPMEATIEVKRAIVAASLEAFGVPIDRIRAAAEGALASIDASVQAGDSATREETEAAATRIAQLEAEIVEERQRLATASDAQQARVRSAQTEKSRIRVAVDFFGGVGAKKALRLVG